MARITFANSDTLDSHVTKINRLMAEDAGDLYNVEENRYFATFVAAVNGIRARLANFDDSAEVLATIRNGISAVHENLGDFTYSKSTGVLSYEPVDSSDVVNTLSGSAPLDFSANQVVLDQGMSGASVLDNTLSFVKESDAQYFFIYDSADNTLLTLRYPDA